MKSLLPLGLAALLASPAAAQICQVEGTIKGIGATPILVWYTQQGQQHTDTVRAVHDRFTYVAKPSDDGLLNVYVRGPRFASFWYEPGRLKLAGDAAKPGLLTVTGAPENDVQTVYQQTIERKYLPKTDDYAAVKRQEELVRPLTLQFIKQHPLARTSAHLLYWQTVYDEKPLPEYARLYSQLAPAVQQSYQGRQVAQRLHTLRNQPTLGQPVAGFSIADTAGVQHSLATYRGKYVLLDFWGHWCGPCLNSIPKVKLLHAQYADRLTIIGIAAEAKNDLGSWKQVIRQRGVPGLQLSELQSERGPVVMGYNITAFPTYLLLDPQGKLVARTNDVDAIAKKLATLGTL